MKVSIWWFAFGYFACYVPYSALTKAVSKGIIPGYEQVVGFRLLPLSVSASAVGMVIFITAMRWWKYAPTRKVGPLRIPMPGVWQALSGICTAGIIMTTTLAYTFQGISIVFAMLLMRGGVLILAPIVDRMTGRTVHWFSWVALLLSFGALLVAFMESGSAAMRTIAVIDIAVYLTAYFIRFQFMSRLAKTDDPDVTKSYFVQEQMVATPATVLICVVIALLGTNGGIAGEVRAGFLEVPAMAALPLVVLIGILSQGTGVFGTLVFLDQRENAFCVPVNRCSSILAGIVASYSLAFLLGQSTPSVYKMIGAGMIVGAILFLTIPPMLARRRAASLEAPATEAPAS